MMKNTIYLYSVLALMGLLLAGCDNFVDIDRPNSQLTQAAVFENVTTADAAMADVYAQLRENGFASGKNYGLSCLMGVYADELVSYESGSYTTEGFYHNALLSTDQFVKLLWNGSYNQIYAANAVLDGVMQSSALAEADKTRLQGEALFVRALVHFDLCNVFGAVPYVTTTDYVANSSVQRMPVEAVYQHIIADLELAVERLPEAYSSGERTRPNKAVAKGLLARVYLYHGDNAEAANMASAVINDAQYALEDNPGETFLKDSPGTLWQLASGSAGANTDEATTFIFYSGPPSIVALSDALLSQFETGDLRRSQWIQEVSDGATTWYYPYKYKQDLPTDSSQEFSIQLRLAEQYLIRAEARARQGELIGAKEDLDVIRAHAGLAATTAVSQSEILDAILQERRVELFTEHGHRFFDLKRFGKLDAVLGSKPGWNSTDALWPLPLSELLVNPFLSPQNPGYN